MKQGTTGPVPNITETDMTDGTLYFIQQTQQNQQDVVVAGQVVKWLKGGHMLARYRVEDAWAPSMNVIPQYEHPNLRFWWSKSEWEEEWAKLIIEGGRVDILTGADGSPIDVSGPNTAPTVHPEQPVDPPDYVPPETVVTHT